MEQRMADRPEACTEAEREMGDSNLASVHVEHSRTSNVQSSAIDSELRACDLTRLRVQDIYVGNQIGTRATVMQQKTQRPVQFEITEQTCEGVQCWIHARGLNLYDYLFPNRLHASPNLSTR